MLDGDEDAAVHERFKIPDIPEMPEEQKLRFEKESLGLYISGNLINRYSEHISKLGAVNIKDLVSAFSNEDTDHLAIHDGSNIVVCGLVNRITNKKTKNVVAVIPAAIVYFGISFVIIEIIKPTTPKSMLFPMYLYLS